MFNDIFIAVFNEKTKTPLDKTQKEVYNIYRKGATDNLPRSNYLLIGRRFLHFDLVKKK